MKITIASNGIINDVKINRNADGSIYNIEFDYTPPELWSDLEIWLNDSKTDKFLDYAKMNLSCRNKMHFSKG
jgi:hypothetical protein